jgi:hypothetical protein
VRKTAAALMLVLLLSGFCLGGTTPTAKDSGYEYKGTGYLTVVYALKVIVAISILSGIAYGALKLMKKYNLNPAAFNDEIKLKAVKTILGDKKAAIIEARGREYLVAISRDNITLIAALEGDPKTKMGASK